MPEGDVSEEVITSEERFLAGHTGRMLGTLTLGLTAVRIGRRALPALVPVFITDLGITPFKAGFALTTLTIFYALLQYPSGRISDGLSRKTALMASLGTVVIGAAILMATPTYAVLLLGVAVIGAGEGLYGPAARALLSDLFQEKRGRAFGIFTMASDLGGITAAGLVTVALTVSTWHTVFLPTIAMLTILFILINRWGDESVHLNSIDINAVSTARRLLGHSRFRWILLSYVLYNFSIQGILGFLPTFLQSHYNLSLGTANALFALFFVIGGIARAAGGGLSDRIPRLYVGGGGLFLGIIGILLLVMMSSLPGAVAGVVVFAFGTRFYSPSVQAYLMDVFPDSSMGGDLGATRTIYLGLGSLGPTYVGLVASYWSYVLAFVGFVICIVAAGLILIWLS